MRLGNGVVRMMRQEENYANKKQISMLLFGVPLTVYLGVKWAWEEWKHRRVPYFEMENEVRMLRL